MNFETLPCFPCAANKQPLTKKGFKDAIPRRPGSDRSWPLRGVPTGAVTGLDVLDIDRNGIPWFNEVPLPATRHQVTRSGGLHLFFRHAEGLRSSSGRIAGVDVRADGGYVIDWGREGFETLWPGLVVDWPGWLLSLIGTRRPPHPSRQGGGISLTNAELPGGGRSAPLIEAEGHWSTPTHNFRARVQWNCRRLERQVSPGRREKLFEVACDFGEIVAEGRMKRWVAEHLILEACKVNGLIGDCGEAECRRQIGNAFRIIEEREL